MDGASAGVGVGVGAQLTRLPIKNVLLGMTDGDQIIPSFQPHSDKECSGPRDHYPRRRVLAPEEWHSSR